MAFRCRRLRSALAWFERASDQSLDASEKPIISERPAKPLGEYLIEGYHLKCVAAIAKHQTVHTDRSPARPEVTADYLQDRRPARRPKSNLVGYLPASRKPGRPRLAY